MHQNYTKKFDSPRQLIVITTICVFIAEALIMILLSTLPELGTWTAILLDSSLIVICILPVLYFSLFRPMQRLISSRMHSEEKFKLLIESSNDIITLHDLKGRYTYISVPEKQSVDRDTIIGMFPADLFDKETAANLQMHLDIVAQTGESSQFEAIMLWQGKETWFLEKIYPIIKDNKIIAIAKICSDISIRKDTEKALHENREYVRTVLESTADGILAIDAKGKIRHSNKKFIEMWNIPHQLLDEKQDENLLNHVLEQLKDPDAFISKVQELYQSLEDDLDILYFKNGKIFERYSSPLKRNGVLDGRVWSFRDITETQRLKKLESRAERLEMAGTIAGQVAHDFNNLLAPIMAYPEFIREELPENNQAHKYLDTIENAASKIAEINQDLLTMGRRGHYNQEILNINKIIINSTNELKSRTKTVTCQTNLCPDLMNIKGGSAQIHRLLSNLLVNAQDAMNNNGTIDIKTENYYVDNTSIAYGRVPKGEYVKLTITDKGCGIPEDIIDNILDPFFSTKSANKKRGSGLGLSVVDAVMKDHSGYLDLSSKEGIGTTFYLYFPISRESLEDGKTVQPIGGSENVLIVDDDSIQREVSTHLLRKLGYQVTSIESGELAINFLKDNPQNIVILDMVMTPGIDGAETYRQILDFNEHQKAIIVSGFSESDRVFYAQKLGVGAFVKKPFTKATIAASVRTELDRKITAVTS